jgi:hypothetical protein
MYVTVKLEGGLGNKLFQVAAMLGYAERHGHTPVFLQRWLDVPEHHPNAKAIQEYFPHVVVLITDIDSSWTTLREKDNGAFIYEALPFVQGNVYLYGWFQTERYFPSYKIMPEILTTWTGEFDGSGAAFLHVRRGDYLDDRCRHHWVDLVGYIRRCIMVYPAGTVFVVCSDDLTWCKENLSRVYGDLVGAECWRWIDLDNYETLAIMMRCKLGGICANSTFSWWGAYFGMRDLVCMPSVWGRPPMPPALDIWPSWCVKIPV